MNRREVLTALCGAGLVSVGFDANADTFPSKPIRFVVAFSPGGGADINARIIADAASKILGAQIVVDNRPGAGANIAAEIVARTNPDGYTLLHSTVAHAMAKGIYKGLNYDYIKDFTGVAPLGSTGFVLAINKDLKVKSVRDLIEYSKTSKEEIYYGSSGNGGPSHLATELFKNMTGAKMQHVPYKGINPALMDLISGRIQVSFTALPAALPLMRSGTIIGLAISSVQRSSLAPDLPTVAESGVPGFEAETWYGALAPTGTPAPVLDKLHSVFAEALKQPDVVKKMKEQGFDIQERPRTEFDAFLQSETKKWTEIEESIGIKLD